MHVYLYLGFFLVTRYLTACNKHAFSSLKWEKTCSKHLNTHTCKLPCSRQVRFPFLDISCRWRQENVAKNTFFRFCIKYRRFVVQCLTVLYSTWRFSSWITVHFYLLLPYQESSPFLHTYFTAHLLYGTLITTLRHTYSRFLIFILKYIF